MPVRQMIKTATRVPLLIALGIGLTACGSGAAAGAGGGDGECLGQHSGDLATVVVDGNGLTYTGPQCQGENEGTSTGELNGDRTLVVWIGEGRFSGDDSVTFTATSVTISSNTGDPEDDADVFVRRDSDAGKAIYAEHKQDCADEAAEAKQREVRKQKKMEADQKAQQDEAAADEAAIEAMSVAELAECTGMTETAVKENLEYSEMQGIPITETRVGMGLGQTLLLKADELVEMHGVPVDKIPIDVALKSIGCLGGN